MNETNIVENEESSNDENRILFHYATQDGKYRFRFDCTDDDCVVLYEEKNVQIFEGGGRGHGRGTATGKYHRKMKFFGYYSSFRAAMNQMIDLLVRRSADVSEMKKMYREIKELIIPLAVEDQKSIFRRVKERLEQKAALAADGITLNNDGTPRKKRGSNPPVTN